jgi:hypothetical protein
MSADRDEGRSEEKPRRSAPQDNRCFTLGDCALATIWLLVMVLVFYASATVDRTFLDSAVFGGAVLCAAIDPSRIPSMTAIAAPLFALGMWLHLPLESAAMLALGCGGVLLMTWYTIRGSRTDRGNLRIGAALPLFVIFTALALSQVTRLTPHTYDAWLLQTDFGVSAAVRNWALDHPWLMTATGFLYCALPLAAALVIAGTKGADRNRLLWALFIAAVLAVPCYLLIPAVGPVHLNQPDAPRNCMPSLHLTWATLLWVNAPVTWLKRFALAFVAITAFATLATGEHYAIDLVAAIPFACAVQWLSKVASRSVTTSLWRVPRAIADRSPSGGPQS